MSDYKKIQKKFRELANKITVLWVSPKKSPPLNLGIKQFKRNNTDPTDHQIFKQNVWSSLKTQPNTDSKEDMR